MTKISTYVVDDKVTALDKWIGSDANMQNKTKNFTPKKLAAYFNENQVINIGTPLQYKYYTLDPLEQRPNGTLTFETEIGPTVNFSSITTFLLSKYTTKQNIVSDFLNFLDGSKVLLFKSSDINSFGFYRISSLEPYEPDPNFFVVTVDYETGNGALEEDEDYMISLVSLAGDFIPTKTSELINDGDDGVNPFISELDINRTEWDEAYDSKINSAEVTGDTTKTLTLTKQDGSTIEASWTDDNTDAVTSVFGRDGDVVAETGDYNTDQVTEGDNLYFTESRSRSSVSLTTTGSNGEATYDSVTGVFNIPNYSEDLLDYVPYTGATKDVDLGVHQLKADSLAVSITSAEVVDIGGIVWNQIDGTFDMGLIGGVTLQAGQELHMYGKATEAISNGQAVMFSGVQGDHILIAKADAATINANPEYFIGIATQDFSNNQFGYVTVFGNVRGLDTTAYTLGSVLYYDSTTATDGLLTATEPTAPNAKIIVAAVVRVHATQGILLVRPHVMPKLNDVQDVYAPSPSDKNGLFWNNTNSRYENNSIIGALGYTPYNATNPGNYITLGSISSTATGLTYTNTTGVFSLTSGYIIPTTIEESNWNDAYSNRITSASTPLSISSNAISISQAGSTTNGYLTSSDWNTFNNKQVAGNYITSLTGEAIASGPGAASVTLNNASVTAKILSGVNITGGTILDTDTMLTAFGKLQNQINSLIGGSIYQGVWNASTNTPTLTSSVGTDGNYYIVNVAGSTNLNGITDWKIGDWAIFHGGTWQKVDNTDAVSSVNGFTGAVSLTTNNIPEGPTNLYYLDSRARGSLSFAAGSGTYNSTTGVITIPTNNNQITNGAGYITLGSLSGSAPIQYNNSTGAISITQSSSSTNGYLSSTDWTTFNNKQNALTNPITGTGTTNYVPKFTGSTALGNSLIFDNGQSIIVGGSGTTGVKFHVVESSLTQGVMLLQNVNTSSSSTILQMSVNGTGQLIEANNATAIVFSVSNTGNIKGNSFIKSGGTSSQFLKADGSVDSTSYVPTSRTLTINGIAYDLSANRSWSVGTVTSVLGTGSYGGLTLTGSVTGSGSLTLGGTPTGTWPISVTGNSATATNADYANASGISQTTYAVSGTTNYIPKFTSGNTIGNSLIYDNGTNVGIGTTSPSGRLTIQRASSGAETDIDFLNEIGAGGAKAKIRFGGTNEELGFWVGSPATERMRITSGGNVGIGNGANVNSRLHVEGQDIYLTGATDNRIRFSNFGFTGNSMGAAIGYIYNVANTQEQGNLAFYTNPNFNGTGSLAERMRIGSNGNLIVGVSGGNTGLILRQATSVDRFQIFVGSGSPYIADDNYIKSYNTDLHFLAGPTGSDERMRITTGGDVLIGALTNPGTYKTAIVTGGYDALYVSQGISPGGHAIKANRNGDGDVIFISRSGTNVGSISVSGSSTSYNTSSDYRLKEDLLPIKNALERLEQLNPINFAWKIDGKRVDGFIAHELAEVIPEAVTGEKDATEEIEVSPEILDEDGNILEEAVFETRDVYQGIDQSKIIPLLVAAMQEQNKVLEELKAEIKILKNK